MSGLALEGASMVAQCDGRMNSFTEPECELGDACQALELKADPVAWRDAHLGRAADWLIRDPAE
jgi:hypothetical protein